MVLINIVAEQLRFYAKYARSRLHRKGLQNPSYYGSVTWTTPVYANTTTVIYGSCSIRIHSLSIQTGIDYSMYHAGFILIIYEFPYILW